MNWTRFLGRLYSRSGVNIQLSDTVVVKGVGFLGNLSRVLHSYIATNRGKRTLDDYMKWRAIITFVSFIDHSSYPKDIQSVLKLLLRGTMPRWIHCLNRITEIASEVLSSLYLPAIPNRGEIKRQVSSLTEAIIKSLKDEIRGLTWMDTATKATALSKVEETETLVGYPDHSAGLDALDRDFQSLTVERRTYFENMISGLKFYRRRNLNLLGTVPNRTKWSMDLSSVRANAYYSFHDNRIILPMAILAPHLFVPSAPEYQSFPSDYVNFGAIGSIIGHEITHGFDDRGRTYGEYGNIRPWWSQQAAKEYFQRSQCLIDQYQEMEYTYSDGLTIRVNGKKTWSENLADNGGLKIAYLFCPDLVCSFHYKSSPLFVCERWTCVGEIQGNGATTEHARVFRGIFMPFGKSYEPSTQMFFSMVT